MSTHHEPYQICFECQTTYTTAEDLLAAHNREFANDLADLGLPESADARWVRFCPECLHDFLYPPVEVTP